MSRSVRLLARSLAVCAAVASTGAAVATAPASAAQRLETFDLPSTQGNIDLTKVKLNKVTDLKASVLLPDGYDERPDADWPVLYLLGGIGDNYSGWRTSGQIEKVAKNLPAIVVMPESGRGFLVDWYGDGSRQGQNWSRYTLDEVVPAIESRYRVRPGRQWHVLGGASMGGYGALLLGGQLPSYFGTLVSFSGLVDSQNPESYAALPSQIGASSYSQIWGPVNGHYATVNNPMRNIANVSKSRVYVHTGNGLPDPFVPFKAAAWTTGALIEGFSLAQNTRYKLGLVEDGVPHAFTIRTGVHDWPYWVREFPKALQWGIFREPPVADSASNRRWLYKTMSPHGNAWGFGFRFDDNPDVAITIERDGDRLKVTGKGTVTITPGAAEWDSSGAGAKTECAFTAQIPFVRTLPAECL